jgi:hypothetical protein
VTDRRLAVLPLGGGVLGVLWGFGAGGEAGDSALGTGLLGLAAGALAAAGWHWASRRHR